MHVEIVLRSRDRPRADYTDLLRYLLAKLIQRGQGVKREERMDGWKRSR
jgi:hypothetical protein